MRVAYHPYEGSELGTQLRLHIEKTTTGCKVEGGAVQR